MTTDHVEVRVESNRFPCDRLRVRRLAGVEAVSRLFSFDVHVVCLDPEGPDPESMLGARVTLVVERDGSEVRRIHAAVAEVRDHLAEASGLHGYYLRVVPRAHRMELVKAQDVFVETTVPEILTSKVGLLGLSADTELRLTGKYPRRELTIQYDETDLAFASRLAEHLGVSFFFEHAGGRDVLVFTDHPAGFTPAEGTALFRGRGEARDVFAIEVRRRVVPSYYAVRDYDYQRPLLDLTGQHRLPAHPGGIVEHGANHRTPEEGAALARVRAEEQESGRLSYLGRSDLPSFAAGAQVRIEGHPAADPLDLLVIEVEHEASLVVAGAGEVGERELPQHLEGRARRARRTARRAPPRGRASPAS